MWNLENEHGCEGMSTCAQNFEVCSRVYNFFNIFLNLAIMWTVRTRCCKIDWKESEDGMMREERGGGDEVRCRGAEREREC